MSAINSQASCDNEEKFMKESMDLDKFYARREKIQLATFIAILVFVLMRITKLYWRLKRK
jgi:hypothetical protein